MEVITLDDTISRQAAIDTLNKGLDKIPIINNSVNEMVRRDERILCIDELMALPSAQPVNYGSTNLIDKKGVLDAIHKVIFSVIDTKSPLTVIDKQLLSINKAITTKIKELPFAQRKGKWIATKEWGGRNYSCSCCNFSFIVDTCMMEPMWNYCPNCGARMMKGEEDERIENS